MYENCEFFLFGFYENMLWVQAFCRINNFLRNAFTPQIWKPWKKNRTVRSLFMLNSLLLLYQKYFAKLTENHLYHFVHAFPVDQLHEKTETIRSYANWISVKSSRANENTSNASNGVLFFGKYIDIYKVINRYAFVRHSDDFFDCGVDFIREVPVNNCFISWERTLRMV